LGDLVGFLLSFEINSTSYTGFISVFLIFADFLQKLCIMFYYYLDGF